MDDTSPLLPLIPLRSCSLKEEAMEPLVSVSSRSRILLPALRVMLTCAYHNASQGTRRGAMTG